MGETCISHFNYALDGSLQLEPFNIPTGVFILHPITCIICFITFLLSILRSLAFHYISHIKLTLLGLTVLFTAFLATATFILDLVVIFRLHGVARGNQRLHRVVEYSGVVGLVTLQGGNPGVKTKDASKDKGTRTYLINGYRA
ncbi:hypothetical protein MPER_04097 [Moniliophthora perniciosa FA553]|nr:hypothetical protein MPER_04097 [Moniliophthora perniciosa FA553]